MNATPKLNEAADGGSSPRPCSASLLWMPGPAQGGGGTAQNESPDGRSWWRDGDLLLVLVETNGGPFVRLVRVNADGEMLDFQDPDTGDFSFGYEASDISWWAKIEESLPKETDSDLLQALRAALPLIDDAVDDMDEQCQAHRDDKKKFERRLNAMESLKMQAAWTREVIAKASGQNS